MVKKAEVLMQIESAMELMNQSINEERKKQNGYRRIDGEGGFFYDAQYWVLEKKVNAMEKHMQALDALVYDVQKETDWTD